MHESLFCVSFHFNLFTRLLPTSTSGNYKSVKLVKDDSTFLALKDTAQAHLQSFIDSLSIHGRDTANYKFGIKPNFTEGNTHQHMWSLVVSYNEGKIAGVFIDSVFELKHIKTWARVTINRAAIEDWSVYNRLTGKTYGNYSEMYLRKKERTVR